MCFVEHIGVLEFPPYFKTCKVKQCKDNVLKNASDECRTKKCIEHYKFDRLNEWKLKNLYLLLTACATIVYILLFSLLKQQEYADMCSYCKNFTKKKMRK